MALSVGLMGAGRIARVHAAVLGSGVVDGLRLAGVCDIREDRAERLAQSVSVPAFPTLSAMLAAEEIDAIAVLTESGNHTRHAHAVLDAGKHVVLEKPASLTVDDVDQLLGRETADARVAVVHQNRFNSPVATLRQAVSAGALGKVVLASAHVSWGRSADYYASGQWRGTRSLDGGALANQGVHHLDLLLHIVGPIERVWAVRSRVKHAIECEDTLSGLLEFASGAQGVIQVTTATNRDHEGSLSVTGTDGFIRLGGQCVNRIDEWDARLARPELPAGPDYSALGIPSLYGFGHVDFYKDFAQGLQAGTPFSCDLRQARQTVAALVGLYEAAASGQSVSLEAPALTRVPNG